MGTHHKGSKREIRSLNAYIKLMRAAETVEARLARLRAEDGITSSQFLVLEALFHIGPMNQRSLGEKLQKSGSNMVTVIDNLEKSGLVMRRRDTEDRRNITIRLTEKGYAFISKIFPRQLAAIMDEMAVFNDEELDELGRMCKKLGLRSQNDE